MLTDIAIFGLVNGAAIALAALGMSLIFGVKRFLNFAYGDFLTLGAYFYLSAAAWNWLPALGAVVVSSLAVAAFGIVIERAVFRRLDRRAAITMTVASMGLSFVIQSGVGLIWGQQVKFISIPTVPLQFGPATELQTTIGLSVGLISIGMFWLLWFTKIGTGMRAISSNADLAEVTGINTMVLGILTWGLGGALAGFGGILLGAFSQVTPFLGFVTLFPVVAAVLLGKANNPFTAAAFGLVIGLASEFAAFYIGSAYKPAMAIAALAILLGIKSQVTVMSRV